MGEVNLDRSPAPIWFVGPHLWSKNAGVERCIRSWLPLLARTGLNVRVGTFHDDPPPLVEGVCWARLDPKDVPHLDGLVVANNWVGAAPARPGIVVHHSVPSLQDLGDQPVGRLSIGEYADLCAAFGSQLAVSEFTTQAVRARMGLPCETVTLFAHNAFTDHPHVPATERSHDVLYASRLIDRKGARLALDAASLLPGVGFTFIDNDPDPAKSRLVVERGHRLIEPVRDPAVLAGVIASHRILLMPTPLETEEAFGLLSIEAQLVGTHVIATRSGGLPETDCGNLTLTDPTPKAIAKHITEALTNPTKQVDPETRQSWSLPASVAALARHLRAAA